MTIVGLDLGTTTGFARFVVGNPAGDTICAYSIKTGSPPERSKVKKIHGPRALRDYDPRPAKLLNALAEQVAVCPSPVVVYFEDVQFAKSLAQAHLWASFRTAMWLTPGIARHVAVPVATLKAFARAGGGQKSDMLASLKSLLPSARLEAADDNEIDAIWLVLYGVVNEVDRAKL
jgi:hypothetical protein